MFTTTTTAPMTAGNCSRLLRGEALGGDRGIRRAEIDRAVDDLGDASARADALIVQRGTACAFVLLTPFRVDRGREGCARARDFLSVGGGDRRRPRPRRPQQRVRRGRSL